MGLELTWPRCSMGPGQGCSVQVPHSRTPPGLVRTPGLSSAVPGLGGSALASSPCGPAAPAALQPWGGAASPPGRVRSPQAQLRLRWEERCVRSHLFGRICSLLCRTKSHRFLAAWRTFPDTRFRVASPCGANAHPQTPHGMPPTGGFPAHLIKGSPPKRPCPRPRQPVCGTWLPGLVHSHPPPRGPRDSSLMGCEDTRERGAVIHVCGHMHTQVCTDGAHSKTTDHWSTWLHSRWPVDPGQTGWSGSGVGGGWASGPGGVVTVGHADLHP